jgi:hypothetical protein
LCIVNIWYLIITVPQIMQLMKYSNRNKQTDKETAALLALYCRLYIYPSSPSVLFEYSTETSKCLKKNHCFGVSVNATWSVSLIHDTWRGRKIYSDTQFVYPSRLTAATCVVLTNESLLTSNTLWNFEAGPTDNERGGEPWRGLIIIIAVKLSENCRLNAPLQYRTGHSELLKGMDWHPPRRYATVTSCSRAVL